LGHVIQQTQAGAYGDDFTLIIRPHPIDPDAARLKQYHQPPFILVEEPELGNLTHLINLLRHVAVIIAPASTITLDAAAADTPIINIAFDGDAHIDEAESCKHWYTSDHYREVVQTGGITLVESYAALDQAILGYLQNPQHNAEGRAKMRAYLIEPFDGKSAKRLVARMLSTS
jgi:CDP-glycerol glycerophosphotransferase (TagB/SpsB family)